jgi:hypothetical protein
MLDYASSAAAMDTVLPDHAPAQPTVILCPPLRLRELMDVRCIAKIILTLVSAAIRVIMDIAHQRLVGHVNLDLRGESEDTWKDRRKVGSRMMLPIAPTSSSGF